MKRMYHMIALSTALTFSHVISADAATALSREEASAIMASNGCFPNKIAAVVHSVGSIAFGAFSSENTAMIIASCSSRDRKGKAQFRADYFTVFFDDKLGWFMASVLNHLNYRV